MLLRIPQTLCDANYVNNPAIESPETGLQFLIHPDAESVDLSKFELYDGTRITCRVSGGATVVTLDAGKARLVVLKIQADVPPAGGISRDGAPLTEMPLTADFDAATQGWRHDGGFTFVRFACTGTATKLTL